MKKADAIKNELSNGIEKVGCGDMTAETGRSIAWMACKYIAVMKVELEVAKARGEKPDIAGITK